MEIEAPQEKVAEIVDICYKTMNDWPVETFDFLELPIGCDGEISFSDWGSCRAVHEGSTQEECVTIMERTRQDIIKTFGKWID